MQTAPFKTLCAMTLVAGVSCMQMVQDRDGGAGRPLQDAFEAEDRPALEAVSTTLEGKTEKQKTPTQKAPSPSPPGSAPASEDGPDITENPDPSSCSTASTGSAQYNADTASSTMCESSSPQAGGEKAGGLRRAEEGEEATSAEAGGRMMGRPAYRVRLPRLRAYWIHTSCLMRYPRCMARNW